MIRSSNPALSSNVFSRVQAVPGSRTMTIQGTVNKTALLLLIIFLAAMFTWNSTMEAVRLTGIPPIHYIWIGAIGGFIVALITIFKKTIASITAPIYGLLEGVFLGALSAIFEIQYPGIVTQAILGTFAVFFMMIFLYKSKIIKPTENFKLGVAAATGGIFLVYMFSMVLNLFGTSVPYVHEAGIIGIGFSLFVVTIAALNLVMDFDFIEQGEAKRAPKNMEWYGAFALTVTLVWLYLEILRLLAKLRSRR